MKRILIIATRQIGDVLLTTPLIRAVRQRWPQAHIEVLGFAGTLGMLRGNPDVNTLTETPARLGWRGFWNLVRSQWRRHDLALVTQSSDRAHLLGWIAARHRSGLLPLDGTSNWWKRLLLQHAVTASDDRGEVHVVAEKLRLIDPWLDSAPTQVPKVMPPDAAPLPADLQAQLRPGAVVMHVPSMWTYKQWPVEHYRELARILLARGHQVLLTGSAGDRPVVAALSDLGTPPDLLDLSGRLDFRQLTGLFAQASLYIGPDTSVSHLAAAAGIPVIAIFGPTNPLRWAPWPAQPRARELFERSARVQREGNVTVMQGSLPCVPCGRAGCEDHLHSRSDCLQQITPEAVAELALKQLAAQGQAGRASGTGDSAG